jgi:hypothetical protein
MAAASTRALARPARVDVATRISPDFSRDLSCAETALYGPVVSSASCAGESVDGSGASRCGEDAVVPDSAPPDRGLLAATGRFPGGAAVGMILAPRHLPYPRGAGSRLDPQPVRPGVIGSGGGFVGGGYERWEGRPERLLVFNRESFEVTIGLGCDRVLHSPPGTSKCARKSLSLSKVVTRPAAMSSSASRSICCHSGVQNHA